MESNKYLNYSLLDECDLLSMLWAIIRISFVSQTYWTSPCWSFVIRVTASEMNCRDHC
jgi:hypothetical protein